MHLRKLITLALIFLFVSLAFAQNVDVDLVLTNPNAQIFIVGDLDPTGMGNAPNFFQLILRNNEPAMNVEMQLLFELQVGGVTIADAMSDPFILAAGVNIAFNNNNLNTGSAIIPATGQIPAQSIELDNYNVDYNRVDNLKDQILATGRLPNDQYLFMISWRKVENNVPAGNWVPDPNTNDNVLVISNPTTIEAIYPGSRVSEGNLQEVMTTFPYILYQSDASEFNIFVYEKYTSDNSIQDVLSHDPVLAVRGYPNLLFQYPTDPSPLVFDLDPLGDGFGGSVGPIRSLEANKTYYYYVQAVVLTSGGQQLIDSDVYQFKVAAPGGTEAASNVMNVYLQQLLSGPFANLLAQLEGFTFTGKIFLNGTPVQMDDLNRIINMALQNQIEIKNIYIE